MSEFYDWLINIGSLDFRNKSALIIGGSEMAKQYASALSKLGVTEIIIIAKTGSYISDFCKESKIELKTGGYEKNLPNLTKKDLVIVAPPIQDTIPATKMAIENGQRNILMEKPGSLYHQDLTSLAKNINSQEIRIGYNRLAYPNLHRLMDLCKKEGGITSSRFTFTERLSTIDFEKDMPEVYERWGISNSLHVITMAFELIGLPKEINCHQYGKLEWHPSGAIFIGDGISESGIPFSYHADWGSGGRWGVEVNTKENSYQLIPLEDLYACPRDTGNWNQVNVGKAFPDVKQGIPEEVAIMLDENIEHKKLLPSLEETSKFNIIAEKIFGYSK